MAYRPKYTEEKLLYFAEKPGGFNINTKKEVGTTLQSLVDKAKNNGYIERIGKEGREVFYGLTPAGKNRLTSLQAEFAAKYKTKKQATEQDVVAAPRNEQVYKCKDETELLSLIENLGSIEFDYATSQGLRVHPVLDKAKFLEYIEQTHRHGPGNFTFQLTDKGKLHLDTLRSQAVAMDTPDHDASLLSLDIHVDHTQLMNLTIRAVEDVEKYGSACLDTNDPAVKSVLSTGWFETVAIDDAGSYVIIAEQASDLPQLLNDSSMSWDDLLRKIPSLSSISPQELTSETPSTLSEYRQRGLEALQLHVKAGTLSQHALLGVNDLHWDESFGDGVPLADAVNFVLEQQKTLAYNSPSQFDSERKLMGELAYSFLVNGNGRHDHSHIDAFSKIASESIGRPIMPTDAEHVLKSVAKQMESVKLHELAEAFIQDNPTLEPQQIAREFAPLASEQCGRTLSTSEIHRVLHNVSTGERVSYELHVEPALASQAIQHKGSEIHFAFAAQIIAQSKERMMDMPIVSPGISSAEPERARLRR